MNTKAVIAVIVLFVSLPFAAASNSITSEGSEIEGRSILFDLTRFDPDLAAVAGLAQSQINWFGGAVSFDKGRDGWVYATSAGAAEPDNERLIPTGQFYNFTDDNGATWNVQEWYYLKVREVQYKLGDQTATERSGTKVHVWTVHTSAHSFTDSELQLDYNFVVVVDVSKLGMIPIGGNGQATGPATNAHGGPADQQIDLHFTRTDPAKRCVTC